MEGLDAARPVVGLVISTGCSFKPDVARRVSRDDMTADIPGLLQERPLELTPYLKPMQFA